MNKTNEYWNSDFLDQHPMYRILSPFARDFVSHRRDWPDLADYQAFLESGAGHIFSAGGKPLRFVHQGPRSTNAEDGYEPRIFLRGEIQTRLKSWHDFFQVLVWRMFPLSKRALNKLHYSAIKQRTSTENQQRNRRSSIENVLTQFDECGGLILSTSPSLLHEIKQHAWKNLFWEQRTTTAQNLKCIVFGHALFEKGLSPYIGMTSHCVMLQVDPKVFNLCDEKLVQQIDNLLSDQLLTGDLLRRPADLQPFPLLGLPGWHPDNDQENFYDNSQYFRPARKIEDQFTV